MTTDLAFFSWWPDWHHLFLDVPKKHLDRYPDQIPEENLN